MHFLQSIQESTTSRAVDTKPELKLGESDSIYESAERPCAVNFRLLRTSYLDMYQRLFTNLKRRSGQMVLEYSRGDSIMTLPRNAILNCGVLCVCQTHTQQIALDSRGCRFLRQIEGRSRTCRAVTALLEEFDQELAKARAAQRNTRGHALVALMLACELRHTKWLH